MHTHKKPTAILRRLKIIEGQVRGLQEMVEKGTYCIDVITQSSAVKQGLSTVEDLLMENHLNSCVHRQMTSGQTEKALKKAEGVESVEVNFGTETARVSFDGAKTNPESFSKKIEPLGYSLVMQ